MSMNLNSSGLDIDTLEEVVADITAKLRAKFGPNVNTDLSTLLGQLVNIQAEAIALVQQRVLDVYQSFAPDGATGVSLDQRAALTGSMRDPATFSTVEGTATFSSAGTINDGDIVTLDGPNTQWAAYDGPYTASGPFPETLTGVKYRAVDPGPLIALTGSTWTLTTVVAGMDSFDNTEDATPGSLAQTDAAFRRSRKIELYSSGQGPLAAIDAVVSKVPGVTFSKTYHNPNVDPVDADGIPFKATNTVVETSPNPPDAALQQRIHNAIWSVTGGGGQAYGTDFIGTVVDVEGQPQPSAFDVTGEVDIWFRVTLTTSTSEFPVTPNLEQIVADAILDEGNSLYRNVGQDVRAIDFLGVIQDLQTSGEVTGIDVALVEISDTSASGPFVTTKISIGIRDRADYDSARIEVNQA